MSRMRSIALAAAAILASLAVAEPGFARPQSTAASESAELELATMLADPAQAARFLARPDCLDRLAALQPSAASGALDKLRAALGKLLVLDDIRPQAQLALGVLNHHLGFTSAAENYLQAALADEALPPGFRERANALLDLGRRTSRRSVLSGSLIAGLDYDGPAGPGALAQSPEELMEPGGVQDLFVQADLAHRFDTGWAGTEWQSTLQAQTTRVFAADRVEDALVALSSGPRLSLDRFGLNGGLRLQGAVDFGAIDDRLDWIAPGGLLLLDWASLGGNFAIAFDWRERRFRNSAASPNNSGRSGRELAGRLAYDFRVADWLAASASARYADYAARRAEESYGELQFNFSLRSDLNPLIERQSRLLVSSDWHLGSLEAAQPSAVAQHWTNLPSGSARGGGIALSQSVGLLVEGGWTRRDALFPHLEYESWFGKTGITWQF